MTTARRDQRAKAPRLHAWLVNLASRPERRAAVTRRLNRAGVPFDLIVAVGSEDLPPEARAAVGLPSHEYDWVCHLTGGMLALRQTWLDLLDRLQQQPAPGPDTWHVVIEDDARLVPGFRRRLERLLSTAGDHDVVLAGYSTPESWYPHVSTATNLRRRLGLNRYRLQVAGSALAEWLGRAPAWDSSGRALPLATTVVAVRQQALPDVASWLRAAPEPIDASLRRAHRELPGRVGFPRVSLAHQVRSRSDISWAWMHADDAPGPHPVSD